ncbi:MAG: hypothetical protein JO202_11700, partial [Ktedonobacteraceae bacterium]|nr:hypothetical protein [Ktedonobacteraceae bacterium]
MREDAQVTAWVWNPILRQYLVNAPHRMSRGEGSSICPFCADMSEGRVATDAQVWLHPNDFPPLVAPMGEAYIVVYSRDHERTFSQLTVDEVTLVTKLWRGLYCELSRRYPAVMIFENSGEAIGQTQDHPHGQVYGVSLVPPTLERELDTVVQEYTIGRGCPFCRMRLEIEAEYQVAANKTWQAFLPPYARYPYETHLYPRRHVADLAAMGDEELRNLAALLLCIVHGYNALFGGTMEPMPYMLG